jgi:hypothetical protein
LDADLEAELRQICGANFAKRSNDPQNGGRRPGQKNGRGKTAPGKPVAPPKFDDVPELDDVDFADFADFAKSNNVKPTGPNRRPRRK